MSSKVSTWETLNCNTHFLAVVKHSILESFHWYLKHRNIGFPCVNETLFCPLVSAYIKFPLVS